MIRLRLYSRQGCHLCEEMLGEVERARAPYQTTLEIVDIDFDRELVRHYDTEVPVLFVNGRKFAKYRVDWRRLSEKLAREAGE
jgi:glutaredoxin